MMQFANIGLNRGRILISWICGKVGSLNRVQGKHLSLTLCTAIDRKSSLSLTAAITSQLDSFSLTPRPLSHMINLSLSPLNDLMVYVTGVFFRHIFIIVRQTLHSALRWSTPNSIKVWGSESNGS